MKYISTRNKNIDFSFKDIFLRGLAPDGGLFVPKSLKKYDLGELKDLKKLSYIDLATEIILNFCENEFDKKKLNDLIKKSYKKFKTKNIVEIKKIGNLNFLELYNGPTLAFKDIAMQVIGNMYDQFTTTTEKKINIIVATSGDTGAAAISALNNKENINVFVLHPHNKISNIQRKIMTTIGSSNIFNLAVKGTFDDCQKIVKEMFSDDLFRKKINMSGVNSINWALIICQIVYYFYAVLKLSNDKLSFSVPTGNFGDVYSGYVAKKMGLPINKLIVATNENDILQRVISSGEYKPSQVKPSLSPSMDIQVSSNFERLLFDLVNQNDQRVSNLMKALVLKGHFNLDKEELNKIKNDFSSVKITDKETLFIIKNFKDNYNFDLDPHTATAVGAVNKLKIDSEVVILGTAHPYKFLETIKLATGKILDPPDQFLNKLEKEEKYDIIDNKLSSIKDYILKKAI